MIDELIKKSFLKRIEPSKKLIEKELREAEYDLEKARSSLLDNDYKWSTIKSYYSMFHAPRAMLIFHGLKERKHFAVSIALEELAKKGKLKLSLSMTSNQVW